MKKIRVTGIKLPIKFKDFDVIKACERKLGIKNGDIKSWRFAKKSIDARRGDIKYIVSVDIELKNGATPKFKDFTEVKPLEFTVNKCQKPETPPIIVGFGPGGIFAALILAQAGLCPIVIERGSDVDKRRSEVNSFHKKAILNVESNVQFGEGGAGTFSDGKLNTGIKSDKISKVLEELVKAGAPEEIMWDAKPHVGTDKLAPTVKNIREEIIKLGGKIYFETKLTDIEIKEDKIRSIKAVKNGETLNFDCDKLILAIGHSARDTFEMLKTKNIAMQSKAFSVGVRIEHKAEYINRAMYGKFHKDLPAADYKLSVKLLNGRGVYTFCMCPGGYVIASSSENETVVTNGMSEYKRDATNSNSAVLVGIGPEDFGEGVLDGMYYQRELEKKAFALGGKTYKAPCQRFEDFLRNKASSKFGEVIPSYAPGVTASNLNELFPDYINTSLQKGIQEMNKRVNGFASPDALLTGVESRSSSPIRILRGEDMLSLNIKNLYPCAEGAGYAGGIMSAAVDGISCALALINSYSRI